MNKVKYSVGYLTGSNGTGNIYLCETTGGTEFLAMIWLLAGPSLEWKFLPRSTVQSHLGNSKASISGDIDLSKMPETAPSGLEDADGFIEFGNATDLPREYDESKPFFSIRGSGIPEYTGANSTPQTGATAKTGTNTVVVTTTGNAKTGITEAITQGVDYAMKNPLLVAAIIFILLELTGATNVLGLTKKKTRARRR